MCRTLLVGVLVLLSIGFSSAPSAVGAQDGDSERARQERIAQTEARRLDGPIVDPDEARRLARAAVDIPEDFEPPDLPQINTAPGTGLLANLVMIVVFAAIVAAVVFVIIRIARRGRTPREEDAESADPESSVVGEITDAAADDGDWAKLADAAAARGEFAEAVRYLHLAGVVRLDDDGHIDFDASKTNGDYIRALIADDADAAYRLRTLSHTMEATTFGSAPADRTTFEAAGSEWTALHGQLRERGRPRSQGVGR